MPKAPQVDFLVMGAGVAGLRAAIELAQHGEVLVVTKESLSESNTHYAQGGIAVAMEGEKDVALHLEDTVRAGDGLVYRPAAEALVSEGPLRVAELIEWGAHFDEATDAEGRRLDGQFLRTREGAHSLARILHSSGDATGAEISRALVAYARAQKNIRFAEWTRVANLVVADSRVIGVDLAAADLAAADQAAADQASAELSRARPVRPQSDASDQAPPQAVTRIVARSILIAAGGAGQVYSDTTNPAVATGDGIALAAQAGAELADMEFYQFHPTALAIEGAPRFLISEALRGEGAYLRNHRGERFMERYHPLLELAPRDVVARAIAREGLAATGAQAAAQTGGPSASHPVYLDMRHIRDIDLIARFPGISAFLAHYGLDLRRDLIPVRPAAHYLMGGIRTDLGGRTSLAGLYAAGEAACTGVHGANRLASNSLLEGLVFGARAARSMLADALPHVSLPAAPDLAPGTRPAPQHLSPAEIQQIETLITSLQANMWANAGLLREASSLRQGLAEQAACEAALNEIAATGRTSRRLAEAQALSRIALAILTSALARHESRGAHFRSDHPRRDDANFCKHSVLGHEGKVRFEE
jgi:L-aspartate oxidase